MKTEHDNAVRREKMLKQVSRWLPFISAVNSLFPFLLRHLARKQLSKIEGFNATLENISLFADRSMVTMDNFRLEKKAPHEDELLFFVPRLDIIFDKYLLKQGRLRIDAVLHQLALILKHDQNTANESAKNPGQDLNLEFNRVEMQNSMLHYTDASFQPPISLEVANIDGTAVHLFYPVVAGQELPTKIHLTGKVYEGFAKLDISADLLNPQPSFDVNAEIKEVNLVKLNPLFRSFGNFDVNRGTLELFAEIAAKDGAFKGYVKPFIENLDVVGPEDKNEGFWNLLWENLVGTVAEFFQNQKKEDLASKIPFEGKFKKPQVHMLFGLLEVLRHAFLHALRSSIDYEISIDSVKKGEQDKGNG